VVRVLVPLPELQLLPVGTAHHNTTEGRKAGFLRLAWAVYWLAVQLEMPI